MPIGYRTVAPDHYSDALVQAFMLWFGERLHRRTSWRSKVAFLNEVLRMVNSRTNTGYTMLEYIEFQIELCDDDRLRPWDGYWHSNNAYARKVMMLLQEEKLRCQTMARAEERHLNSSSSRRRLDQDIYVDTMGMHRALPPPPPRQRVEGVELVQRGT